jgi:hypothetical protein
MIQESEKVRTRRDAGCTDMRFWRPLSFCYHGLAKVVEESEQNVSFASVSGGRWQIASMSALGHGMDSSPGTPRHDDGSSRSSAW